MTEQTCPICATSHQIFDTVYVEYSKEQKLVFFGLKLPFSDIEMSQMGE